jgi:hypothetical protein
MAICYLVFSPGSGLKTNRIFVLLKDVLNNSGHLFVLSEHQIERQDLHDENSAGYHPG